MDTRNMADAAVAASDELHDLGERVIERVQQLVEDGGPAIDAWRWGQIEAHLKAATDQLRNAGGWLQMMAQAEQRALHDGARARVELHL